MGNSLADAGAFVFLGEEGHALCMKQVHVARVAGPLARKGEEMRRRLAAEGVECLEAEWASNAPLAQFLAACALTGREWNLLPELVTFQGRGYEASFGAFSTRGVTIRGIGSATQAVLDRDPTIPTSVRWRDVVALPRDTSAP